MFYKVSFVFDGTDDKFSFIGEELSIEAPFFIKKVCLLVVLVSWHPGGLSGDYGSCLSLGF